MNKKKIIFIIIGTITLAIIALTVFLIASLSSVSDENEYVDFEIKTGTGKFEIVENLVDAGLINNEISAKLYLMIYSDIELQAGNYSINRADTTQMILNQIGAGRTNDEVITVTFVEGKSVTYYAEIISENFGYEYDDVINVLEDKEYAEELIAKYQGILTNEILDDQIYYPLEGYLSPNTYEFYKNATIKEIIEKLIQQTVNTLTPLKNNITNSGYTIHEILTVASIAELEGLNADTRQKVSQVIYSRLAVPMSLGMDVTAYYGVQVDLKEPYLASYSTAVNGYNTRRTDFLGLPIGPITNPSFESITSALNPSETSYLYFVADVTTGDVYFFETLSEFEVKVSELRSEGKL